MACMLSSVNYHCVSAKMIRQAMRNTSIDSLDHTPSAVIAIGTDYPPDYLLPLHSHRRAQLLYGATGVMQVFTRQELRCHRSAPYGSRRRSHMKSG